MGLCGNDPPDPASGVVGGIKADLETLPMRRIIDAAALLGNRVELNIPGQGMQTFDFTGLGEADYQRRYADQMMGEMLQLQRDLGPQYVEQRLAELEAADPEGARMRRQMWETIKSGVEAGPTDRPGLETLQDLILSELEGAGKLSDKTEHSVSQRVKGVQVARGNYLGNAAATEEAGAMVDASEAQRSMRQQQAMAFLTGGLSPDDAAFRESQQNMANLGAFIGGETPVAQFGQLSAAEGVVPWEGGRTPVGVNPNAGWEGVANSQATWGAREQARQGQVNPWVAGLSGAFQGLSAYGSMGGFRG